MKESDKKNVQAVAVDLEGADECLSKYVERAVLFVRGAARGGGGAWEQQLTPDQIMKAYGLLKQETEYVLLRYYKLAPAVKPVYHILMGSLLFESYTAGDPFVTALLEADPMYCEYQKRNDFGRILFPDEYEEDKTADSQAGGEKLCQSPIMEA